MPQLTGTAMPNPRTMMPSKTPLGGFKPTANAPTTPAMAAAVRAAANASQRSCWRSSPVERRARMTIPTIAVTSTPSAISQIRPGAPFSMSTTAIDPSGLGIRGAPLSWIDAWSTKKPKPTITIKTAPHASHRERVECKRPSGNRRKKKVASPAGKTSQFNGSWIHATQTAKGRGPKCELLNTYSVEMPLRATMIAMPRKIQPIGLRGFLAARSVPMIANPIGRITSTGSV